MKIKTWTVSLAVLTLAAAPAFAEESLSQFSYDEFVKPVGCDTNCGSSCGSSKCGGSGLLSGMGSGRLENLSLSNMLGMSRIDVGGWTQFGYHDNLTGLSAVRGDGASFNDVPDKLNLQQQYFYLGKQADGSNGFDWGFRADFMYGTDAQKTQSFGNPGAQFDNGAAWDHGVYGWAIPQLYAEVAMGDFSVIAGRFYTLVGYETVTSPQNFFYSRSLTAFNSEPFTHTGVLTTYSGFENITFYGGWTLGWDTGFTNANSGNSWLGGFAVDLSDSVKLTYINTYGNFGLRDNGDRNSYSHSIVFDVAVTSDLQYVFQTDLVDANDVPAAVSSTGQFIENNQIGINQYLIYRYNDLLSFGSRIEWWKNGSLSNYEYTSGVNVQLLDNLVVRPEYRKDWVPGTGLDRDVYAFDVILTY